MTFTSTRTAGSSDSNPVHRAEAGTGHFMLTLCRLAAPVSIRPPQSPHLKPFTFFTSRARQPDGSERLYLHMGYFATLADAERWVDAIRGRYPEAIATIAPAAFLQPPDSEASASHRADIPPGVPPSSGLPPANEESLSDTQVMRTLDMGRPFPVQPDVDERHCAERGLLPADDTSTRQPLKAAVAQGASGSFAVQLHWSAEPIDPSRLPALAVFKAYTLYGIESRREGSSRYFLRMGFFGDPISAKQVANQMRSNFASAAVVPVGEDEILRVREAGVGGASIPCLVQQRLDRALDSNSRPRSATESEPSSDLPRRVSPGAETLEETLEHLAEREIWTDPDSLSESGVRHLRVEVQAHTSRRS